MPVVLNTGMPESPGKTFLKIPRSRAHPRPVKSEYTYLRTMIYLKEKK